MPSEIRFARRRSGWLASLAARRRSFNSLTPVLRKTDDEKHRFKPNNVYIDKRLLNWSRANAPCVRVTRVLCHFFLLKVVTLLLKELYYKKKPTQIKT